MPDRTYDLVLFGASGFTGALTAEYLARAVGASGTAGQCRWALAGRDLAKLEAVRDRLAAIDSGLADLPLLVADAADPAGLREIVEDTRVVATTVGPYIVHGEPLVAACAAAGTDYLDLTGEPEFVDLMYVRYHERAKATGARIVHCCGFDSIPHDLGAYYTVGLLPDGVPIRVDGYVRAALRPSGGTVHSAVTAFSRARQTFRAAAARRRAEHGEGTSGRRSRLRSRPPHLARGLGWALPFPSIDPQVVIRSARALPRYGPDFTYGHHFATRRLTGAVGLAAGTAAAFVLAQPPPTRSWLLRRFPAGSGPTTDQRAANWFKVRFTGMGGGHRVVTEVAGGDPGYDETAKMFGESALCLAFDDLPETAGQVTTAVAMGDALIERLRSAGITFTTLAESKGVPDAE
ncbi:MAG TPA: saccharopine dehydrogenase NADP-binding domain-containing protein [Streptosporangiaceae bacterium]|jgi:saccharopine dehydrogenase (NAD+, L-glutamate forming)